MKDRESVEGMMYAKSFEAKSPHTGGGVVAWRRRCQLRCRPLPLTEVRRQLPSSCFIVRCCKHSFALARY
ncbi:hypothetical protein TNCV_836401 [Trichonephila clavipes]|nr:hypothetical protein TNCV_836401 [Trichonephila clavipes]